MECECVSAALPGRLGKARKRPWSCITAAKAVLTHRTPHVG